MAGKSSRIKSAALRFCREKTHYSDAVLQLRCAGRACAVDTTEDFSVRFDAVAHDTAIAMRANRRQRVDCALEAIKDVALSAHDDFKRIVVIVVADFALSHTQFVRVRGDQWRCLFASRMRFSSQAGRHHRYRLQIALRKFFWS